MGTWTTWRIDHEASQLVGPCGCRVPNTLDGMLAAKAHECDEATS